MLSLLLALVACGSPKAERVIVLGFDGLDPDDVRAWKADLPALSGAIERGELVELGTTTPPQSPVAWSTFATSRNPGGHGIFDFIRRDPGVLLPDVATGRLSPARFGPDPAGPKAENLRHGRAFWEVAAEAGVAVRALSVPYDYPPPSLPGGEELAGLGAPDIRLTTSSFTVFDDAPPGELAGGRRAALTPIDGGVRGVLEGPSGAHGGAVGLALDFAPEGEGLSFVLQGKPHSLRAGASTELLDLRFPVAPQRAVDAWASFALLPDQRSIYVSPLMPDPRAPYLPLSSPPNYAAQLFARYGRFRTIGWLHDTSALQAGVIDEDFFLSELRTTFEQELRVALGELDRGGFRLFLKVFTEPDRVAHMFTRFRDPEHPAHEAARAALYQDAIRESYQMADRVIREVQARLQPGDMLIVLSDHGFHSSRRGVDVNRALVDAGLLATRKDAGSNLGKGWVDWEHTRAYAIGTGQVYLNLRGRESKGVVEPGEAAAVRAQVRAALLALRDPKTGEAPLLAVYEGAALWHGDAMADAPDLQLAFAPGYQVARRTTLGGLGSEVFEDNRRPWSGDHAASEATLTKGVLWIPGHKPREPNIIDLGPTILRALGVEVPEDFEGRGVL